jgi:hypothetical protein
MNRRGFRWRWLWHFPYICVEEQGKPEETSVRLADFSSWGTSHMQVMHVTDWANLVLLIMTVIIIKWAVLFSSVCSFHLTIFFCKMFISILWHFLVVSTLKIWDSCSHDCKGNGAWLSGRYLQTWRNIGKFLTDDRVSRPSRQHYLNSFQKKCFQMLLLLSQIVKYMGLCCNTK